MSAKSKTLWIVFISILAVLVVGLSTTLVLVSRSASYSSNVSIGYSYTGAVNVDVQMKATKYLGENKSSVAIAGSNLTSGNDGAYSFSVSPSSSDKPHNFSVAYEECTLMGYEATIHNKDIFPLQVTFKYTHTADNNKYDSRLVYGTKTTASTYPYGNYLVSVVSYYGNSPTYTLYRANSATSYTSIKTTSTTGLTGLEMCEYSTSAITLVNKYVIVQPGEVLSVKFAVYSSDYNYTTNIIGNIAIGMAVAGDE